MTALEAYARHGSVSYGPLTADRLRAILAGQPPGAGDLARVEQALMETPGFRAYDLAVELAIPYEALNARVVQLLGRELPS